MESAINESSNTSTYRSHLEPPGFQVLIFGGVHAHQPQPSCVWGDVNLTGYMGSRDWVIVGFDLLYQTGRESLSF